MDAYYTRTLRYTAAQNSESRETMDIIKNSMVYDIAILYDWGGWTSVLEDINTAGYNYYYDMTSDVYISAVENQIISTIIDFELAD